MTAIAGIIELIGVILVAAATIPEIRNYVSGRPITWTGRRETLILTAAGCMGASLGLKLASDPNWGMLTNVAVAAMLLGAYAMIRTSAPRRGRRDDHM